MEEQREESKSRLEKDTLKTIMQPQTRFKLRA